MSLSIWTKEKEYKIYFGKKKKEYENKLSWLARSWDIPRGATNYSGTMKMSLFLLIKYYNIILYRHYRGNVEKFFEVFAGKKIDFLKDGQRYKTIKFSVYNAGIIRQCIDFWCSELGYTVSDSEKIRRQNRVIQNLFNDIDKELGLKEIPMKRDIEKMKEWIKKNDYLFRKYIDGQTIDIEHDIEQQIYKMIKK